ncbi:MAG: peptidylprolyl isomerase [Flavobacteriales bacterium]|jgi:peptidyl-prolyl cis-trans isomerase SurA|nr:peptidylprolyl isomerase [Flavobacteriales bacterium]
MCRSKIVPSLVASVLLLSAQAQQAGPSATVLTVDGHPVAKSEFEAIYKKNNKEPLVTREALDEYMELFINYKLKVREAQALGMDTISRFRTELEGYRKQLVKPYLIDRSLNDALIKEAHDRSLEEVRASHILVSVQEDAAPEDTLAAWRRVTALRDRVVNGESFAEVARGKGGSDDPSAAGNGGDLGWFSALQMVYPFETAAYNTPVGQVSRPVRTRFGYHIVQVNGRRPARGKMRAAHIMMRSTDADPEEKRRSIEDRVREVHRRIVNGEITFADAALRYSEDEGSSTRGGELPEFSTGKMIEEFEDAAYSLQHDGDVAEPVLSRFGWHIIKRIAHTPPPDFEQAQAELKNRIARDSRAEITRTAFLKGLRTEYQVQEHTKNLKAVLAQLDTTVFLKGTTVQDTIARRELKEGPVTRNGLLHDREVAGMVHQGRLVSVRSNQYEQLAHTMDDTVVVRDVFGGWRMDRSAKALKKLRKPVLAFKGRTFTQQDLLEHIEAGQRRETPVPLKEYLDQRYRAFVDEKLLAYEEDHLDEKHPGLRLLLQEYHDGILLFELTDDKVWGRAVRDTAGLEAFFAAHRDRFTWPRRHEATLYTCANAGVAKELRRLLAKGVRGADLVTALNKDDVLALQIDAGTFTEEEKPVLKGLDKTGLSADLAVDGHVVVADVVKILPPGPKELDEARGAVTAAYQDSLEKAWIEELRAKYPWKVDREVLYSIK